MNRSPQGRVSHPFFSVLAIVAVVALLVLGYVVLGPAPTAFAGRKTVDLHDYQGKDPTGVPAELKSASPVERGEYLARAADCVVCHTAKGGAPFAGGLAFVLPFGTIYSTNITPDPETGIGDYTDVDFLNAVHKGIGKGNSKLYPAMPYPSYTAMSDADALAIKEYLFSLKPVHAPATPNTLAFPFNQRALMGIWSAMFNADRRYRPHVDRSDEWNRGAYLVESMAHCGECHTPRNLAFALNNRRKFGGAVQAGWRAYNISPDQRAGVGAWSDADLVHYLSMGHADGRGTAAGPMGEAVDESLGHLKSSDVTAIVAYLRTVPAVGSNSPTPRTTPAALAQVDASNPNGKAVYEGACAGCHGWTGTSPVLPFASLSGTRSVNDPAATNVAQIIIGGGQRHYPLDAENMPAFGGAYSDGEIAAVANYVTSLYGAKGSDLTASRVAKLRAEE